MKITKLLRKHNRNCDAIKNYKNGTWKTPWFFKDFYYLYIWHRVGRLICNSTNCKAEMRIDIDEIEQQFNKFL